MLKWVIMSMKLENIIKSSILISIIIMESWKIKFTIEQQNNATKATFVSLSSSLQLTLISHNSPNLF